MKKIAVLDLEDNRITEALQNYFKEPEVFITTIHTIENLDKNFDLIITNDYNGVIPNNISSLIINIHPSLLPAFEGEAAIVKAYQEGVKVSGVTIHNLASGKIIAQYPVLISNLTSFLEFESEIKALESSMITVVTDKLLKGQIFDFSDLLGGGCHGGCGGNCGHCS